MKFLHTADWQIGKPFASIEDPSKRERVRNERIESIRRMARLAAEHEVAFVLVVGDLFDSSTPDQSTVSAACSVINAFSIPVYVIPGNHDHGGPGGVWEQPFFQREQKALAPNLHLLLTPEPVDTGNAIIFPCPLLRRAEAVDTTSWLRGAEIFNGIDTTKPRVVLAHGSVQSFGSSSVGDEDESATNHIDIQRLATDDFDYIALGDWHGTKQITEKAWYSGTPEVDRFPKGGDYSAGNVLLVELERGARPQVTPLRTGGIQWAQLDHDFSSDPEVRGFQQAIKNLLSQRAGQDLLLLRLRGSLGIRAHTTLTEELEALAARLLSLRILNETTVVPDDTELAELTSQTHNPLAAEVARQLIERSAADGEEGEIARIALRELYSQCHRQTA